MARGRRRVAALPGRLALVALLGTAAVARAGQGPLPGAADDGAWHAVAVPGGRTTLAALGVDDASLRATVMVDLIRRLHFGFARPTALEAAIRSLSEATGTEGESRRPADEILLPLPLSAATWSTAIFARDVPARRLFVAILSDPSARLLFHGLAGLDAGTRRWFGERPDLLGRLYRHDDAVRAFALFAPALRIVDGRIRIPGGDAGVRRWTRVLETSADRPERFVERLFDHHAGRTAGLYFLAASVEPARQRFLLSAATAGQAGDRSFTRLVAAFAQCYPAISTATYPFVVRSHDAALLLLDVDLTADGVPAGPRTQRFWLRVFDGPPRPGDAPGRTSGLTGGVDIDAAWMVEVLCAAPTLRREAVFTTILAGHRTFAGVDEAEWPDAVAALRARQAYPALFIALEHAGLRRSRTYAAVAARAATLARLEDPVRGGSALRQFQGAVALTLGSTTATSVDAPAAAALLESLAAVPIEHERYDGRIAEWFERRWRPAVAGVAAANGPPLSAEDAIAVALAGPADPRPRFVHWEGLDYVVDVAGATRQRLREVRRRQGGPSIDVAFDLYRLAVDLRSNDRRPETRARLDAALASWSAGLTGYRGADEYGDDAPDPAAAVAEVRRALAGGDRDRAAAGDVLLPVVDLLLGQALASWAYAPHVGESDSAALTGGDGSLRHTLGLRAIGRNGLEQRWALPVDDYGATAGSLLGLQAVLAPWSLRRLSSDVVPAPPTIGATDLTSFLLSAALSDERRLTDAAMTRLAAAVSAGQIAIDRARGDAAQLVALGDAAAISPWRREALSWATREAPGRVTDLFSLAEQARLGGLDTRDLDAWGSASIASGCLCLRMPPARIPEVILGRAADGIVAGQSTDLMLHVAIHLTDLKMPAPLAAPVFRYAMRDFLDAVAPRHTGDTEAFARQARALERTTVEDYLAAIAATGPLRPVAAR